MPSSFIYASQAAAPTAATALKRETHGFLFAFQHYDRLEQPTLFQRVARNIIRSNIIHVAVLPAHAGCADDATVHQALTGPVAYTAFMGSGFERQHANQVLDDQAYEFVFLPVPDSAHFQRGLDFLNKLDGAGYNYLALALAVMPRSIKAKTPEFPNWITDEHPFFDDLFPPHAASSPRRRRTASPHYHSEEEEDDDYEEEAVGHRAKKTNNSERIFCSQLGLLLCYACNALPHYTYDPASCLPAELLEFLMRDARAIPAALESTQMLASEQALVQSAHHHHYYYHC